MKRILIAAALASAAFITPAFAGDVGVSVSIGQPGFYGQIDIGGYPPPPVIYRQPRVIEPVYEEREPIYLRVPPGYAKHWSRHCHEYNACGERVYFVQDGWYSHEYAPHYQEEHRNHHAEYRDDRRDEHRDDRYNEHRNEHRDEHRDEHHEDHRDNHHDDEHDHEHEH